MPKGVSVIVCCYNSSLRLPETLCYLAKQRCSIPWEIIIVDNNSSDNTSEAASKLWECHQSSTAFSIVQQPVTGLSAARQMGVLRAKYEYMIFCDDDNWLDKNYVNTAFEVIDSDNDIAIVGGIGYPVFGGDKPNWFDTFYNGYAVYGQDEKSGEVKSVYGAGMVLRKSFIETCNKLFIHSILSDRKGNELSSGGDAEICYWGRMAGFKIWFDERLAFKHYIPMQRLSWDYLKKLHIGFAKSFAILNLYEAAITNRRKQLPSYYWLKKAFYMLLIYIKYSFLFYKKIRSGKGEHEEILLLSWVAQAKMYLRLNIQFKKNQRKIFYYKQLLANHHGLPIS
ncbi:glycosyltransferase family 2 protein [Parasediminibacterium sp. JCM 36343]|uniref:glycosyltransferase family 2 protein n=1 Tax=Parasediminibacterium sp. JCM 36343 TaxID=3374279 RepID=UPI003978D7B5